MTKEEKEIIELFLNQEKYDHFGFYDIKHESVLYPEAETIILIKQYADQQTESLRAELDEKTALYEQKTGELMTEEKVDIVTSYINRLEAELTELKEKHKRDVKAGYARGYVSGINSIAINEKQLTAEEYYKQTHEND